MVLIEPVWMALQELFLALLGRLGQAGPCCAVAFALAGLVLPRRSQRRPTETYVEG
jgi:hypothetical protein